MGRFVLVLIIIGAVLTFAGVQEMRLASGAKPEPQEISCSQLIQNGPGDNAHVLLKDFLITPAFVYETGKSGNWKTVWVPAVPHTTQAIPSEFRVIVKSSRIRSEAELDALANQDTLQGLVMNKIASLGSKEKKILTQNYPKTDFDKVIILEHGRKPASAGKSFGMIGGGLVLAALGVMGIFRNRQS